MSNHDRDQAAPVRPAAVYRLYDAAGALLYVGKSIDPDQRTIMGHRGSSPWWTQVARQKVTWFRSEDDALSAEARAIATENPAHNVQPGRIIPHLGGPDAILTDEEARRAGIAWWIRQVHPEGASAELMTKMFGLTRAEIEQALGEAHD
jgi:hypothetical protein